MARKRTTIAVIAVVVVAGAVGVAIKQHRPTIESTIRVSICSFNIQFLGHFTKKQHASLAEFLKDFDAVVVQKLVAPPYTMDFPGGSPVHPDPEAREFFDEMVERGFSYVLSEEDTGTGDEIHKNSSATEWWVTFYKPHRLKDAGDLPSGFLAEDRSNHDDYKRVPYAFGFRTPNESLDFVLISVHLKPGDSRSDAARRNHELDAIAAWLICRTSLSRAYCRVAIM